MENISHTIRGRTKSPRTLESNSKDPLSAAYIDIYLKPQQPLKFTGAENNRVFFTKTEFLEITNFISIYGS